MRFVRITYPVLLLALQVLVVRNLVLFDYAFAFVYVGIILLWPRETNPLWLLLLAAGIGLLVDVFYDTLGIHAAATTLLAFLRPTVLKLIMPSGGYELGDETRISSMGVSWFVRYAVPLLVIHHLTLFFIEAAEVALLPLAMLKALASAGLTLLLLLLFQYALEPARRRL